VTAAAIWMGSAPPSAVRNLSLVSQRFVIARRGSGYCVVRRLSAYQRICDFAPNGVTRDTQSLHVRSCPFGVASLNRLNPSATKIALSRFISDAVGHTVLPRASALATYVRENEDEIPTRRSTSRRRP